MGLQAHFISLDIPLSRRERDKTTISLRSIVALRVAVFDRNLKTRCIRFALAGFVEPSARVLILFHETKSGALRLRFLFQGERGIRQHFLSVQLLPSGLRSLTAISKPAVFASLLRVLSNPYEGSHPSLLIKRIRNPQGVPYSFQGERGIRTLGPVTDSGFRDRPIRPLWHLSEVCTI